MPTLLYIKWGHFFFYFFAIYFDFAVLNDEFGLPAGIQRAAEL